uniref:Prolyl 4-hydroxylase alpha subunit Fe(2+) 2OG dioxygenase domain-containing protein n=1 Tax=Chromera velia CCMP2878 TaxID=1169474 RepID=A0A0G4H0E5_9ALVE|eukprot:Cvel_24198.t1-p1 / transcript=Cvel_24198.t1 / gene=Cvel_24198 / organism=Chromera_velia_CCMP2878 / gene_product=hypothetical protein / transcript_product=hypothetical protein / location=Cvel_scaffold2585:3603-4340(-) / protein_length=246 / sequence_SO=supercontig / SO=protein_coding / is_pseudo=false
MFVMAVTPLTLLVGVFLSLSFKVAGKPPRKSPVFLGPEFQSDEFRRRVFENGEVPEGLLSVSFPTDESLNRQLREELMHLYESGAEQGKWGCPECNVGSWRSPPALMNSTEFTSFGKLKPVVDELLSSTLDRPDLELKGLFGKIDHYQAVGKPHVHHDEVTGIYYIDPGDATLQNGPLVFFSNPDRRSRRSSKRVKKTKLVPQKGMMLIWPSNLMHTMPGYKSDRPRMSVVIFMAKRERPQSFETS